MANSYKCGRRKEFFDCDPRLMEGGGGHHLPVSCTACPYTIFHTCFTEWMTMGHQGYINCPNYDEIGGFHAPEPSINHFPCLLLSESQTKPAAKQTAAEAHPLSQMKPAAGTPPPKKKKRKQPDFDSAKKTRRKSKAQEFLESPVAELRAQESYSLDG